ncbi:MAG: intradiol ring-cleavage dioxygenase [Burkholderiales bacterium]
MRDLNHRNITEAVIARFDDTPDPRLKQIFTSLVQHLHDFAREVKLSEAEWAEGIRFLTETGQKCDDQRQEFILLSDVLGLSMLTVAMNHDTPYGCTEPTVFGPFHVDGAPDHELGADIANGAPGAPCQVSGTVCSSDGQPLPGAVIEVWQADAEGHYDVQVEGAGHRARGVFRSDANGRFAFRTVVPQAYPIPDDGPVGELLRAGGRHPWRPAHLHFMVDAPGHELLVTHVFRSDDAYLDSDAVFGVRQSLVADWHVQPDGSGSLHFDFVLAPSE